MKKIYHLSSCNTCKNILKELNPPASFVLQDIKKNPVTEQQLRDMRELAGTYESLFNKRAKLYRSSVLPGGALDENGYYKLLLEHYTFLKRPVIIIDDQILIGNSKEVIEAAKIAIHE